MFSILVVKCDLEVRINILDRQNSRYLNPDLFTPVFDPKNVEIEVDQLILNDLLQNM